jgi:hypothetical protein
MAEAEKVVVPEDDFDKAFAEAAQAAQAEPVKVEMVKEEPKPEVVKEEPKPEAAKVEPVKEEPKSEVVKVEPVKEEPKPEVVKVEPVKVEPVKVEPVVKSPEQIAAEAALKDYEPTADEQKALETFAKDFPTERIAIEARLQALDRVVDQRVSKAVKEVLQIVYKDFAPIAQGYSTDAQEKHVRAVHEAVPDFDAIVGKVPVWIKTQPTYLQPAMQAAYDKGSTADVIDLFKTYKVANGAVVAAPVVKPKPADADDLAPVNSKRSTPAPKGGADKDDFDGAFAEAAAALK